MKKIQCYLIIILVLLFFQSNLYALNIKLPYVQYTLALDLYSSGRYHSSIKEFNNLINEHQGNANYIGKANYWLGLNYFNLKKYKTADSYFQKVVNNYPNCSYYKHSLYYHGRARYKRKHYNTAIKVFSGFYTRYPNNEFADNSMFWKGVCHWRQKKNKPALSYFYRVIKKYPTGNKADASRYMIQLIKGGPKKTIIKTVEADTSYLDDWAELLKTKEHALKEKEDEIKTKEDTLKEKEGIINHAQDKLKIPDTVKTNN